MNVPPSSDVAERLAAVAGQRPRWPLVEPTPRWIRLRSWLNRGLIYSVSADLPLTIAQLMAVADSATDG